MILNNKQKEAVAQAKKWFASPDKQVFTIGGYAGTGKTTVAKAIIDELSAKPAFVAYTGKAANVMATKGMHGAGTIHSLIYKAVKNSDGSFSFFKKKKLKGLDLIVLDEASMVGKGIFQDLLSFNIPILALGDPGQLPPVASCSTGLLNSPDVLLEEIMRQDEGSGIVRFADYIRKGNKPRVKDDGKFGKEVKILPRRVVASSLKCFSKVVRNSQCICGYNVTRKAINYNTKELVLKKDPQKLEKGDKIIALRNNRFNVSDSTVGNIALANGLVGIMESDAEGEHEDFNFAIPEIKALFHTSLKGYGDEKEINNDSNFDLAYAITCHKSQGSEYDNLTVFDEAVGDTAKWRYTAVTRAKKQLLYLI